MKKLFSLITALLLTFSIITPSYANAAENISYKEAIEIAKEAFDLNTKDYNINHRLEEDSSGKSIYSISWNSKDENGSINVSINASTGDIIQMYRWESSINSSNKIPKYTKEEAQKTAEKLIKKLQPEKSKSMILQPKNEYQNDSSYLNDTYSFTFIRVLNGIYFPENSIRVEIDKNTLIIRRYSFSWDDKSTDTSKAIDKQRAMEIFKEKLGLELSYKLVKKAGMDEETPILVYTLKNGSYPIDAITGEIINNSVSIRLADSYSLNEGAKMFVKEVLTPEEQKSIEEFNKLITKEAAILQVKNYVPSINELDFEGAALYSTSDGKSAVWSLNWRYEKKSSDGKEIVYGYASAEVDALNSKLISFYMDGNKFYPEKGTEPSYTKEQAKAIGENFLKKIQNEKFELCQYIESKYPEPKDEKPSSYSFQYTRKHQGALVPFNTMYVSVNAYTGQVMAYNLNWKDIELPDADSVIKLDDAYKSLFEKVDFSLKYIRCYNNEKYDYKNYEVRPAYVLDNIFRSMDAKTGELLDYNGKPLKKYKEIEYKDIKGNLYEKDIKLLIELGIIDDASQNFRPNEEIKQQDFIKMLIKALSPYVYDENDSYERYYEEAIRRNIISKSEKVPGSKVTNIQAAKMLTRALGIGAIADYGDIYSLSFKDSNSISVNSRGYAAIVSKLDIIKAQNGYFKPSNVIKRGEAASIIVKFLMVNLATAE